MRRTLIAASIAVAFTAAPAAAFAARAFALNGAEIFSGPGNDYPVVAQLGRGVAVNVNGCLADYSWCDVSLGGNRGWAYAGDLAYPYRNGRVPILEYGTRLSLPVITFSLGNYWDRYYRGRPFYGERARWEERWRGHEHEHDRARAVDRRDDRFGNDRGERDRGERDRGERDRGERDRGERDRGERDRGNRDHDDRGRDRGEAR